MLTDKIKQLEYAMQNNMKENDDLNTTTRFYTKRTLRKMEARHISQIINS